MGDEESVERADGPGAGDKAESPHKAGSRDRAGSRSGRKAPSHSGRKTGRLRCPGWLSSIITGIISGVIVAFYLTPTGQATLTAVRHRFAEPSCSSPQWLLQVPDSGTFANAYYFQLDTIPPYEVLHVPDATVDGDIRTSWLQLWPSPSTHSPTGSSDYIEWTFQQRYDIRLICIVDGWTEDSTTYMDTLPIGSATIYVADPANLAPRTGSPPPSGQCSSREKSFTDYLESGDRLKYTYQWQGVPFHCLTSNVVLHIDTVSATSEGRRKPDLKLAQLGTDDQPLTGISEVRFYYCPVMLCYLPDH